MPDYFIAYRGGRQPESPEEGAAQMEKWKAWVGGLGDAAVNPGTPLGNPKGVSSDGVTDLSGPDAPSGFSIVRAANMDEALEIAGRCPFLEMGTLEVAEVKQMPG